jgi:hypothetical protein
MITINEKSDAALIVTIYNSAGELYAVDELQYCITDVDTGTILVDHRVIVAPVSTFTIELTPTETTFIDDTKQYEYRLVSIHIVYQTTKIHNDEYTFRIKNLIRA